MTSQRQVFLKRHECQGQDSIGTQETSESRFLDLVYSLLKAYAYLRQCLHLRIENSTQTYELALSTYHKHGRTRCTSNSRAHTYMYAHECSQGHGNDSTVDRVKLHCSFAGQRGSRLRRRLAVCLLPRDVGNVWSPLVLSHSADVLSRTLEWMGSSPQALI